MSMRGEYSNEMNHWVMESRGVRGPNNPGLREPGTSRFASIEGGVGTRPGSARVK